VPRPFESGVLMATVVEIARVGEARNPKFRRSSLPLMTPAAMAIPPTRELCRCYAP